jgi:shikimate kinase
MTRPAPSAIVLIGMPGSGKSTVGALLASRLGIEYLDTDQLIEEWEGRTVAELASKMGAEAFLDLEARHVMGIEPGPKVISTGGSVVYRSEAIVHLRSLGTVVFLNVDPAVAEARVLAAPDGGMVNPSGLAFRELHEERLPLYRRWADYEVDATGMGVEEVAGAIQETT